MWIIFRVYCRDALHASLNRMDDRSLILDLLVALAKRFRDSTPCCPSFDFEF